MGLFSTALYYWNILAYLLLLPLVPLGILSRQAQTDYSLTSLSHRLLGTQILGTIVAWLLVINYCLVPISALLGPAGDPDGRMSFGWHQVAAVVNNHQAPTDLLLTTDYRSASALAYALNDKTVLAVSDRIDQFDIWAQEISLLGQPALVLADDWHPFTNQGALQLAPGWQQVTTIPVKRLGIKIKDYYLYSGVVAAAQ